MPIIHATDGSAISFTDQGSGPAVLFLHGWMMSKKVWNFQLPLASKIRIITLDLRGHGRSDATYFSYAACLHDIETLLDYLGVEKVIVVGWSMGSQIAIKACALCKERISGLVLVGGTACFCRTDDYSGGLDLKEARGMAIRLKRNYQEASRHFFRSMFSPQELASLDLMKIAANTTANLPALQISLAALQALTDADLRGALADIQIPALLVHGAEDSICPVESAKFMAEHLPRAVLTIIPAAGHAPFLSLAETFNAELTGFVRMVYGGN